jgi:hypothetical protein
MRGKYKRKKRAQKTLPRSDLGTVSARTNQESPAEKEREPNRNKDKNPSMRISKPFVIATQFLKSNFKLVLESVAVVAALAVLVVYGLQLSVMQHQLRLDQRAWIGFVLPSNFPLDGEVTPATLQVTNFGKTPARQVEGNIIATLMMKIQEPSFDYSVGHPHNRFYAGAVFPNSPFPVTINVQRYEGTPKIISPADLRKELETGQSYIVFYGEITYEDVFGKKHWTRFCTGSGTAMQQLDALKKCIAYNDVDHDK